MDGKLQLRKMFLTCFLIIGLAGCSQKAVQQESEVVDTAPTPVSEIDGEDEDRIVDEHEFQLGLDALSVRDDDSAKRLFERFSRKNPEMAGAYMNLALIAYRQSDYVEAGKLVDRVMRLNSEHAEAYHLQALLFQQAGDIREAELAYKKTIELKPDHANAHYNLALLYDIYLQNLPLAIEHYSQYLKFIDREDNETRDWIKHLESSLANG